MFTSFCEKFSKLCMSALHENKIRDKKTDLNDFI